MSTYSINKADRKVAVITGASRGIGLATVQKFINDGWWVCACVRNHSETLNNILSSRGQIFLLDLANEQSVTQCAKDIVRNYDNIDALVNSAGVAYGGLFSMTKISDLRDIFQINYFSQILFTQIIAKKMIRKRCGSIVNISSTSGILADNGTLAYGCSKAALSHATKIMATELGAFNIRVNAVAPARVDTDMGRMMDSTSIDRLNSRSSLSGEICSHDVAELIYYICSDSARYLSGQVIRLDRGMPF